MENNIVYFLCEIFYIIALALNFIFFRNRRMSDFITSGVFLLNSFILAVFLVQNQNFNITLAQDFVFSNTSVLLKLFINLFLLGFSLITYKIIRKLKFRVLTLNSILITLGLCGSLLTFVSGFIPSYLLLEISVFLIYSYASNMRIRKTGIYSLDFISISLLATVLFVTFYLMTFSTGNAARLSIIKVCMSAAFFLKIGFFPIYNYIIGKNHRINLSYSLLVYYYLPFLGVVTFSRISEMISIVDEVYKISILLFTTVTMLVFATYAYKSKNLVKFLAAVTYCLEGISICGVLFLPFSFSSLKLSALIMFLGLSIYSLICILKINLNPESFNISILKGLFFNNRFFCLIASFLFLAFEFILPLDLIKEIYIFDKYSVLFVFAAAVCNILILFNVVNIIKTICSSDNRLIPIKLTKRTTLNYVVPVVFIICLTVNLFL